MNDKASGFFSKLSNNFFNNLLNETNETNYEDKEGLGIFKDESLFYDGSSNKNGIFLTNNVAASFSPRVENFDATNATSRSQTPLNGTGHNRAVKKFNFLKSNTLPNGLKSVNELR